VTTLLAVVVGGLYAVGLYLMLRRSIVKLIIGLVILGHAANLLIFTIARPVRARPALINLGEVRPPEPFSDPVPQALILTAIVIGFGVQAFAVILIKRVFQAVGTDDLDAMNTTDALEPEEPQTVRARQEAEAVRPPEEPVPTGTVQ
jgi:multicomponent Na+:H+ antiporter subunit C